MCVVNSQVFVVEKQLWNGGFYDFSYCTIYNYIIYNKILDTKMSCVDLMIII